MSYSMYIYIRRFLIVFVGICFTISTMSYANAVTCQPPFNGTYNVTTSCTYPAWGIRVYGNINVWAHTITVPSGRVLGINLASNKVTFTSGKILFQGTAKMDNSVSARNLVTVSYTASTHIRNCPTGYSVLNTAGTAFQWWWVTNVGSSGTIRCGRDQPV